MPHKKLRGPFSSFAISFGSLHESPCLTAVHGQETRMQTPFTPTPARAALTCLLAAAVAWAAPRHAAEPLAQTRQAARAYEIGAGPPAPVLGPFARSEERRVGEEGRSPW